MQQFLLPSISQPSIKKKKITRHTKRQFKETEQTSEIDSDIAEMLKIIKFKTTMYKMQRALMDKVDNIQKHVGNTSTEIKILRTNRKSRAPKHCKRN